MRDYYTLDKNGEPVLEPSLEKWCDWFESDLDCKKRRLKRETIGGCEVSTVFLGLDHAWGGGPPVLWETMIFGGEHDQYQDRCSGGREQAEAMHAKAVKMVKEKKRKVKK